MIVGILDDFAKGELENTIAKSMSTYRVSLKKNQDSLAEAVKNHISCVQGSEETSLQVLAMNRS